MAQDGAAAVDLETLQAQVDLSMAVTNELVSSWIHPSLKTRAQPGGATVREVEKELQDLLRRPPRLGVGASLPESAGANAREEAKLKYKLVGNDKKRARGNGSEAVGKDDEGDEGDEKGGKGESSTKRARLDPFSASTKNKKKAKPAQELADVSGSSANKPENGPVNGAAHEDSVPNDAPLDTHTQNKVESPGRSEVANTTGDPPSPISAKKNKKKKKRKQLEQSDSTDGVAGPSETNTHGTIPSDNLVSPENDIADDDVEEWTGFGDAVYEDMDLDNFCTQEREEGDAPAGGKGGDSSPERKEAKAPSLLKPTTPSIEPLKSVVRSTQPLLNLSGPPPDDLEDDDSGSPASPKKKRRRRKKNKSLGTETIS